MQVKRFELHSNPDGQLGDMGLKILGQARDGSGRLARVWLRRKQGDTRAVWNRYLEPVPRSRTWEVRLHLIRGTGAMTAVAFTTQALDDLAKNYSFTVDPDDTDLLKQVSVDDPIYALVRDWVLNQTTNAAA